VPFRIRYGSRVLSDVVSCMINYYRVFSGIVSSSNLINTLCGSRRAARPPYGIIIARSGSSEGCLSTARYIYINKYIHIYIYRGQPEDVEG